MKLNLKLIQLQGTSEAPLGLYSYDPDRYEFDAVENIVANMIEAVYQKEEAGELDDVDVQTAADEELEKLGICRVSADPVYTDRL